MTDYIPREAALSAQNKSMNLSECRKRLERIHAADVVSGRDFRDCRNELCSHCGFYKHAHEGACDGCRWRDKSDAES